MASTSALANGPIELMSSAGQLEQIPLAALYFDATGHIMADHWPPYRDDKLSEAEKDSVEAWLAYLVDEGLIRKGAVPAPGTAMIVTARDAGAQTNNIVIEFSSNANDTKVDAELTETDVYPGLTVGALQGVIGTASQGGTSPGLVVVQGAVGGLPVDTDATKLDATTLTLAVKEKADSTKTAFTLLAKAPARPGADLTTVAIDVDDAANPPNTFTLTATWTKKVSGVTPLQLDAATNLGYEIKVAPPAGGTLAVPAPGIVTLRGGADPSPPVAASATVIANG